MPESSIYDHPLYYDILFGWDRDGEAERYARLLRRHGVEAGGRLLEVACGTGQVGRRLARAGWAVTGMDLSQGMLDFLRAAAEQDGVDVRTVNADISDFDAEAAGGPFDGAFCPLNSLGLLPSDAAFASHFRALGDALRSGGAYVIDVTTVERTGPDQWVEEWEMQRDGVEVRAVAEGGVGKILVTDPNVAGTRETPLELSWESDRSLEAAQFESLVRDSGVFEIAAVYPEVGMGDDGTSAFSDEPNPRLALGRSFVVLSRL